MRRTPLRSRSKKRETVMRKRRKFREEFLAEHPDCVVCGMRATESYEPLKIERAVDIHEPLRRSQGGSILDPKNALPVCREHHTWIHENVAEAISQGLLVPSWQASA